MGVELEVFDHEGSGGVIVAPGDEGGDTGQVEDPPEEEAAAGDPEEELGGDAV